VAVTRKSFAALEKYKKPTLNQLVDGSSPSRGTIFFLRHPVHNRDMPMEFLQDELLRAIELALAGDWDGAHELVQQNEKSPAAAWIHAVLHKMEGDLGNARYWYHRAGRLDRVDDEPGAELIAIRAQLGSNL
jgi:hypothetical protein